MSGLPHVFPTVVHMLEDACRQAPSREALVCGDDRLTYASFARSVARLTEQLIDSDACGGRVAILMENSADLAIALMASIAAGAQATPLNPAYTRHELGPILEDAAPRVIIASNSAAERVRGLAQEIGLPAPWHAGSGARRLIATDDNPYSLRLPDPDCLGLLQYTGGTTGRPKGVELTNRATAFNVSQREAVVPTMPERERALLMTPLYHVYATAMGLYLTLYARGTLVIMTRYTPEDALDTIEKERITFFAGSPTIYQGLLASPRLTTTDFSSLTLCFSGASALPTETLRRWKAVTGCSICEAYGQTEAGPVLTSNPKGGVQKAGSVGIVLPETRIEIVDVETRAGLPSRCVGEIRARGPQIMKGYRNRPEETHETLREGWLYTGDIGFFDEEGYLHISDRKKDMIIVSGYNVFPREIEETLHAHPAVREAAAFGVPHARKGEVVHVHVVCDGDKIDAGQLMHYLSERLVSYKLPAALSLVSELPKTSVGKIDKAALRQNAAGL